MFFNEKYASRTYIYSSYKFQKNTKSKNLIWIQKESSNDELKVPTPEFTVI